MWRERSCHWLNGILSLPVQYDLPRQPRSSVVYTTYSVVIQAMGCPLIAASISHTIQCTQVKKQWNELCVDGTIQSSEATCNPDRFIIFFFYIGTFNLLYSKPKGSVLLGVSPCSADVLGTWMNG